MLRRNYRLSQPRTLPSVHVWLFIAIFTCALLPVLAGLAPAAQAGAPPPLLIVTSDRDGNSPGTLRWAIATAPPGSIIRFNLPLPAHMVLSGEELVIDKALTIEGLGAFHHTLSGSGSRLIRVTAGAAPVQIKDLAFGYGAASEGGAIYNEGDLHLLRVEIRDSFARGQVGRGGAILNNGHLVVESSLLHDNHAEASAPIAQYAYAGGGAIWNWRDLEVINTTIVSNTVACVQGLCRDRSGGAILSTGNLTVTASTISDNATDGTGPGIYQMGGALLLRNSILAGCAVLPHASGGHNLDTDGSCGLDGPGDISNADPRLDALRYDGGPTMTRALLPASPARDAGAAATCPPTDQRGALRPADGNGDGAASCDIGAFEAGAVIPNTDFVVNSAADTADGWCDQADCTLREAIQAANAVATGARILFAIPGDGPHTIRPQTELPWLTSPVTIDGFSQPGATPNSNPFGQPSNAHLLIELDGSAANTGLTVMSGGALRGLVLNRFAYYAVGGGGAATVTIQGCYIGTDVTGAQGLGNGVGIGHAYANVGGPDPAARTLISGNGFAVTVYSGGVKVEGSYIGTDAAGVKAIPNQIAIDIGSGGIELSNSVMSGNGRGASVFNSGMLIVRDSLIGWDATGTQPLGNQGAAFGMSESGGLFTNNRIAFNGAGIFGADSAPFTVKGGAITDNRSAAIFVRRGGATIDNVLIARNQDSGVVLDEDARDVRIIRSTITDNHSAVGAGIRFGSNGNGIGDLTLIDSTVSNNQATTAGGGISNWSKVTLINSTVAGNTAAGLPSGIDVRGAWARLNLTAATVSDPLIGDGPITAQNSILGGCAPGTHVASQGHNLDGSSTCALTGPGDLSALDLLLGPLQDNGGPTWTRTPLACSPAIDAGSTIEGIGADQRGLPRPRDGNGDGQATPDIGAVELQRPLVQRGAITIIKDAVPDSVRNFRFFGPFGIFRLDDPGFDDGDGVANTITYSDVIPGRHGFSDDLPFRWWLTNVTCDPAAACEPDLVHQNLQVTVRACQHVMATFTNSEEGTLFAHSYWDKNGNRNRETSEPLLANWWTELYDLSGGAPRLAASNFTNVNGKWNVRSLVPGREYAVCQKPQATWQNTQPGQFYPEYRNWPCYTFRVQPAQGVEAWFGYGTAGQVLATALNDRAALDGLRYLDALLNRDTVLDTENDAMYTEEEYVDPDLLIPEPATSGAGYSLYLPALTK